MSERRDDKKTKKTDNISHLICVRSSINKQKVRRKLGKNGERNNDYTMTKCDSRERVQSEKWKDNTMYSTMAWRYV